MKIKIEDHNKVIIGDNITEFIISQSVEANLLYAILEKLDEIRRGIIDIENEISSQDS